MRLLFAIFLLCTFATSQSPASSDSTVSQSDRLAIQHQLQKSDNVLNIKISAIDLNDDDDPEFLTQSTGTHSCDASGNCTFWILQKKGANYKTLLKSVAQKFRVRTIQTGGFSDVELGRRDSKYRTEWRGYKYDGTRYIKVKCWADVYGDDEHEKPYPKPKVEPCAKR